MATRSKLKQEFKSGECPSQEDYYAIFDSTINFDDDNVLPPDQNNPLRITAKNSAYALLIKGDLKVEDGKVGIGTPTPQAKLDVAGPIRLSSVGTLIYGNTNESGTPDYDGFRIRYDEHFFKQDEDALIIEKTDRNNDTPDGGIAFVNTGQGGEVVPALVIRGSGNVGIGTPSPARLLTLRAQNPILELYGGSLPTGEAGESIGEIRWYGTTSDENDEEEMARIQVIHDDVTDLSSDSASFHFFQKINNDRKEVFTINSQGNVGIRTNDFTSLLTVNGIIESQTEGFKFPDGSIQNSSKSKGWVKLPFISRKMAGEAGEFEIYSRILDNGDWEYYASNEPEKTGYGCMGIPIPMGAIKLLRIRIKGFQHTGQIQGNIELIISSIIKRRHDIPFTNEDDYPVVDETIDCGYDIDEESTIMIGIFKSANPVDQGVLEISSIIAEFE